MGVQVSSPGSGGGAGTVNSYVWNGSAYVPDTDVIIFQGPNDPKSASGGRDQVNDLWVSTGYGDVAAGQILGRTSYRPGADGTPLTNGSSTTIADADATNLTVTFTVPASGNVVVTLNGTGQNGGTATAYWGLRQGTSQVGGMQIATNFNTGVCITCEFTITGLTPGASVTYKWAYKVAGSSPTHSLYAGPNYGSLNMTVRAL